MHNEFIRFNGPATVLRSYMTEFIVVCPQCQKDALVTVGNPYFQNNGKLRCHNCMYAEEANDLIRYRVTIEMNCPDCGEKINECIPNTRNKVESMAIKCRKCSSTHLVKPRNESFLANYNSTSAARDPVFDLPLWLQVEVKNNVFWAYNRSHLADIKAYVQSDLRERQTTTHTTMVERLPNFIKKAKNRLSIIKVISQLERKL